MRKKSTEYLSTKVMTNLQKKGYFSQIQNSIHIEPCYSTDNKMIILHVEVMLQKKKYMYVSHTENASTFYC